MATASINSSTPSIIDLAFEDTDDRAWVTVQFKDSASPSGKLVKVNKGGGTAAITGWTNANAAGGHRPLQGVNNGGRQEHTKYVPASVPFPVQISTFKATDRSVPVSNYASHAADDINGEIIVDAVLADTGISKRVQVKRWMFTNGGDQVIITIVMIDDGGGGSPFVRVVDVVEQEERTRLRIAFDDKVFELDVRTPE